MITYTDGGKPVILERRFRCSVVQPTATEQQWLQPNNSHPRGVTHVSQPVEQMEVALVLPTRMHHAAPRIPVRWMAQRLHEKASALASLFCTFPLPDAKTSLQLQSLFWRRIESKWTSHHHTTLCHVPAYSQF